MDRYNGLLPVHKEAGMTSHDVIYKLRRITDARKVGHTGTLDPGASGLLLICFGRATKLTQFLTEWDKSYRATITLGATSDTLDADGTITPGTNIPELSRGEIESILSEFTGRITQKVPAYSAVKVDGRELYKYARKGVEVETPSREVEISELELINFDPPQLEVMVRCSKGTYIRVLADDMGRKIGCGAYLQSLVRCSLGPFELECALSLTDVEKRHESGSLEKSVIPIQDILDFPVISIRNGARDTIKNGGMPGRSDIIGHYGDFQPGDLISMADELGEIMAIGKSKCATRDFRSGKTSDFFSYVRVLI
jgi:tRNA pseudouridine55 synthase